MTIDAAVLAFAGCMTLVSVLLTWLVSPWFLLFTAFIGLNMLQASVTGLCPAAWFFRLLGLQPGARF